MENRYRYELKKGHFRFNKEKDCKKRGSEGTSMFN